MIVRGICFIYSCNYMCSNAVVQLGERMTGSHEVRGSTPLGSTKVPALFQK